MKKNILLTALVLIPGLLFAGSDSDSKKDARKKLSIRNGKVESNNVKANISNVGSLFWDGGDSGFITPHPAFSSNNNNTATIFASGMWLGGKIDGEARTSAAIYSFDYAPGTLETDENGVAQYKDINSSEFRIHYYFSAKHSAFLESLLAKPDNSAGQKVHAYAKSRLAARDGSDWDAAMAQGAPAQPPGDENAFAVFHDADANSRTAARNKSKPLFIEVRQLVWSYRISGALNNAVFMKWDLINRGKSTITDMYASVWSDPDLGNFGDDLVGSDRSLGLGYCYNGGKEDSQYTGELGIAPPAVGYDYFQGVGVDESGSSIYERTNPENGFKVYINNDADYIAQTGDVLIQDKAIKGASSFVYYNNTDADDGNPLNSAEVYNYMRAKTRSGNQFPSQATAIADGVVSEEDKDFFFGGNPEAGSGWLDSAPNDRRFLQNNGPFTITPYEDTNDNGIVDFGDAGYQTVVVGVFSSFGSDNLNSVTKLKLEDAKIQKVFNNAFAAEPNPAAPVVTTNAEDEGFVFNWSNGVGSFQGTDIKTEEYNLTGYTFEGYQVVQFKDESYNDYKQIAIYDIANGLNLVTDPIANSTTGEVENVPVLQLDESGVRRSIRVTSNLYADNSEATFYNGTKYSFGIRAIAVLKNGAGTAQAASLPAGEDSYVRFGAWSEITAYPTKGSIGTSYSASYGDVLDVTTTETSGELFAVVVDPSKLTGATYTASVDTMGSSDYNNWKWNLSKNGTIVKSGLELSSFTEAANSGTETMKSIIYEGIKFTIKGIAGAGMDNSASVTSADYSWLHTKFGNGSSDIWYFGGQGWAGTEVQASVINDIEFVTGPGITQKADLHDRSSSYAHQGRIDVPFIVREIATGRQLQASVVQHTAAGLTNTLWQPNGSTGDAERGYVWIYDVDYDAATTVSGAVSSFGAIGGAAPVIASMGGLYSDKIGDWGVESATLKMIVFKNIGKSASFTVTAPGAPSIDTQASIAANLDQVTIYPNPYTGSTSDTNNDKNVTIQGLPANHSILIYNLQGDFIKTISSNGPNATMDKNSWNFTNDDNILVGSGLYFMVIKAGGKSVIKKFVYRKTQRQLPIF